MRIAILGCGAMGTVLGAYLNKAGLPVDMIDANASHVEELNRNGATISNKENFTQKVHAILPAEMEGIYDVVFLMTKATTNALVLPRLCEFIDENSTVCTLQNGVPEENVAKYIGRERTVGGSMLWGATYLKPGCSELTTDIAMKRAKNEPLFEIGEMTGEITPRIMMIAGILNHMGKTPVRTTLNDLRWKKLVINCCGSGMSAALGSPFGALIENDRAMDCMSYIAYEVAIVAKAAGINIGSRYSACLLCPKKGRDFYYGVYVVAKEGKASMLQDLEAGRKTEVDLLSGLVCATGDRLGIDTPYNDAVVRIVHGIEKGELPLDMSNLQYFPEIVYQDYQE